MDGFSKRLWRIRVEKQRCLARHLMKYGYVATKYWRMSGHSLYEWQAEPFIFRGGDECCGSTKKLGVLLITGAIPKYNTFRVVNEVFKLHSPFGRNFAQAMQCIAG